MVRRTPTPRERLLDVFKDIFGERPPADMPASQSLLEGPWAIVDDLDKSLIIQALDDAFGLVLEPDEIPTTFGDLLAMVEDADAHPEAEAA